MNDGVRDWPRVPPNLFAISFGLAGLAGAWRAAGRTLHTAEAVPDAISVLAGLVLAVLTVCYALQGTRTLLADLRHRIFSPFLSLAPITVMLLATTLAVHWFALGRALLLAGLVATLLVGGFLTGEWIVADLDHDSAHPGYFLPTVAGGFVAAYCAAEVGLKGLAEAAFGIGALCWSLVGSTILNRLFFHSKLPEPFVPTLAIEMAPPAVAGIAYFAIDGGRRDLVSHALAGYAVLMVLVQIRMLPTFLKLRFAPGFWAFVFSWAAVANYSLQWIALDRPPFARGYAVLIITALTVFVAIIAVRTVILAVGGRLLPPRTPALPIPAPPVPAPPAPAPSAPRIPEESTR
ncbi:dicarboxylate transporter/tellurite-resistance protein TehA [Catenulispora yoronensis]|uniref:Dicarboxylate transporter/tellurite-resistance protein TehA n=1 Tax=Catenulispora yoronensis TaxID=450799 RepID=A0ABN2UPT3_9ACTN